MTIPNEQIQKVMKILTDWNPLGSRASTISDLDNYRIEAIDILCHFDLNKTNTALIVRQVINQAFNLSLSKADCASVGRKIQGLIKKQKSSNNRMHRIANKTGSR
jgi:hypothetical protein